MSKIIDNSLVTALLQYLMSRPYSEVYQAIPVLQNLPDALEQTEDIKKEIEK